MSVSFHIMLTACADQDGGLVWNGSHCRHRLAMPFLKSFIEFRNGYCWLWLVTFDGNTHFTGPFLTAFIVLKKWILLAVIGDLWWQHPFHLTISHSLHCVKKWILLAVIGDLWWQHPFHWTISHALHCVQKWILLAVIGDLWLQHPFHWTLTACMNNCF